MILKSLTIGSFRGIEEAQFTDLAPITLFFGENNCGKTSVLEAATLLLRPLDPSQWAQVSRNRDSDLPIIDGLWGMFPGSPQLSVEDGPKQTGRMRLEGIVDGTMRKLGFNGLVSENWDAEAPGELNLRIEGKVLEERSPKPFEVKHTMQFSKDESAQFGEGITLYRCYTITPASHRANRTLVNNLSKLIDVGKKGNVVEALQIFDPAVQDLDISSPGGRQGIRISHAERGVADLSSFGDGMRRTAALAMALVLAKDGLVLIDEVEAGIHVKIMPRVLSWLLEAAKKNNVQILATSHSLETIDQLAKAVNKASANMVGYWLRRENPYVVRRYDLPKMIQLRESGLDLR